MKSVILICMICAVSAFRSRIIGGEDITIERVPYQVSIAIGNKGHNCGGSIISKNYVLTAGHCISNDTKVYVINSGTSFSDKGGQEHVAIDVIRHQAYKMDEHNRFDHDIALMKVHPAFELDNTTTKIIELSQDKAKAGDAAYLAGWGYTERGDAPKASIQLQGLELTIMDIEECHKNYADFGTMPKYNLCAQHESKKKGQCAGDSGGALTVDGKQVGIVSWSGPGCAVPGRPGVFTDVSKYLDWIKEHMED